MFQICQEANEKDHENRSYNQIIDDIFEECYKPKKDNNKISLDMTPEELEQDQPF
jgi:hypothetical protein